MKQKQGGFSKNVLIILLILVVVGIGFYFWQQFQLLKINNQIVEENVVIDETADWKTYRNDNYGFEIKYPSLYDVTNKTEPKQEIIIGKATIPIYGISIIENIYSLDKLKSNIEESLLDGFEITWKDTMVSEEKAAETSYEQLIGRFTIINHITVVVKNNIGYVFQIIYGDSEKEYYQILSTFKFVE